MAEQRRYADAASSGFVLGVVLLLSFVLAGRGLGASGAFAAVAAQAIDGAAPEFLQQSPTLADRFPSGRALADNWIVWQVVGLLVGGALSSWRFGRGARTTGAPRPARLARAAAGGVLMGIGARLAYGCTSGLALSGGATLATGAWLFIPVAFATAVIVTVAARTSLQVE